jgi:hypothetical protein
MLKTAEILAIRNTDVVSQVDQGIWETSNAASTSLVSWKSYWERSYGSWFHETIVNFKSESGRFPQDANIEVIAQGISLKTINIGMRWKKHGKKGIKPQIVKWKKDSKMKNQNGPVGVESKRVVQTLRTRPSIEK